MALDFRLAYSRLRVSGPIHFSPEALMWLRGVLQRATETWRGEEPMPPTHLMQTLVHRAQFDFGPLAEQVLTHWDLHEGEKLGSALGLLHQLGAVLLNSPHELDDYTPLGTFSFH